MLFQLVAQLHSHESLSSLAFHLSSLAFSLSNRSSSCVRDWSGILFETEAEARKDIAESPTAEPERPEKGLKTKD